MPVHANRLRRVKCNVGLRGRVEMKKNVPVRWFQCECGARKMDFGGRPLPSDRCNKCGTLNRFKRVSKYQDKGRKQKKEDTFRVRGEEHGKFLNSYT